MQPETSNGGGSARVWLLGRMMLALNNQAGDLRPAGRAPCAQPDVRARAGPRRLRRGLLAGPPVAGGPAPAAVPRDGRAEPGPRGVRAPRVHEAGGARGARLGLGLGLREARGAVAAQRAPLLLELRDGPAQRRNLGGGGVQLLLVLLPLLLVPLMQPPLRLGGGRRVAAEAARAARAAGPRGCRAHDRDRSAQERENTSPFFAISPRWILGPC